MSEGDKITMGVLLRTIKELQEKLDQANKEKDQNYLLAMNNGFNAIELGKQLDYYKRLSEAAGKMEKCAICPPDGICPDCDIWNTWQSILKEREK
jgi:hypothetical protein